MRPEFDKKGRPRQFINGHCDTGHFKKDRIGFRGEKNPRWKGGRRLTTQGYIIILSRDHPGANNQGYVFEHRLVMEKHLGRYLTDNEEVHHINHDRTDNRIQNLELMTCSKHITYHNLNRPVRERMYWGKNRHLK